MVQLNFKTLSFRLQKDYLQVNLLNIFKTKIHLEELENISKFKLLDSHTLEFDDENDKAEIKFSFLLSKYLDDLINTINGNKAIYIHKNSEIPLIGNVSFGIVYRNTSLIEIKPVTSCNLNCIYCSVGEGKSSKKVDFVVEKDYLVEELERLVDFVSEPTRNEVSGGSKNAKHFLEPVEVHIGVQGEPFLYADLIPLIEDLHRNSQIKIVSLDTNFTLVTKSILDKLAEFDKLRLNISLDALDPKIAEKMAGCKYNLQQVLEMIKYAAQKKIRILLAPLYLPGYNDDELEKIINLVKELGLKEEKNHPILGIQNFLNYKTGRNPVRAVSWKKFYEMIKKLEERSGLDLNVSAARFGIRKTKELPKPFQEGEVVNAVIRCPDRFPNTYVAVAGDGDEMRTISVQNCQFKEGKKIKVKIVRDKHNVFTGKIVRGNVINEW